MVITVLFSQRQGFYVHLNTHLNTREDACDLMCTETSTDKEDATGDDTLATSCFEKFVASQVSSPICTSNFWYHINPVTLSLNAPNFFDSTARVWETKNLIC